MTETTDKAILESLQALAASLSRIEAKLDAFLALPRAASNVASRIGDAKEVPGRALADRLDAD